MRLTISLFLSLGLLLTGCQSSRHGSGMVNNLRFDGEEGAPKVIELGLVVNFTSTALPLTLSTGNYSLTFKLRDPGLPEDDIVFIGPHSSVTVVAPDDLMLNVGWMYWRGPRLVGRTHRFSPGPAVGGMTGGPYQILLQVDPYATMSRQFVYWSDRGAFQAVKDKGVVLSVLGHFAEVIEQPVGTPVPHFKLLSHTTSDHQKQFFNYANKVAKDGGFPNTPDPIQ